MNEGLHLVKFIVLLVVPFKHDIVLLSNLVLASKTYLSTKLPYIRNVVHTPNMQNSQSTYLPTHLIRIWWKHYFHEPAYLISICWQS